MAENTLIEWADHTANLWMGCTKISPACDNCYAELLCTTRMGMEWGPHADRRKVKAGMQLIGKLQRAAAKNGGVDPKLGRRARVFVNSLSDFFDNHKSIDPEWRTEFYRAAEQSSDVILILVTKRPENVPKMVPPAWLKPGGWPAHVWLMVTAEDQLRWDSRVSKLLNIADIEVMGVSIEPMLGPIDPTNVCGGLYFQDPFTGRRWHDAPDGINTTSDFGGRKLSWIIIGGESGSKARPVEEAAIYPVLNACERTGVAFFFKQWGEYAPRPGPDGLEMRRVGKKSAGRTLGGKIYSQFPTQ